MTMLYCTIARYALPLLSLFLGTAAFCQAITLSLRGAPFEAALRLVETQGPWRFVYVQEELAGTRALTFEVQEASLDSVLVLLFRDQPLTYSRLEHYIILKKKETAAAAIPRRSLQGVVVDEEGAPLPGASLQVKGSRQGTAADHRGRFFLQGPRPSDTLLVSAVGYQPVEVTAAQAHTITLQRSEPVLDETVVTGYGYTTRRRATGSFSKVPGRDLALTASVRHPLSALAGRVPGLFVRPSGGLPDAPVSFQIRGPHSLQSGTAPLLLVDGIPFLWEGEVLSQRSGLPAMAPLHPLHPSDVESVEVLRDGDATAIYGSRGSGGVVLITSRRPRPGQGNGSVTLRRGWSRTGRTPDLLSTPQYLALRREAFAHDGVTPTAALAPDLTVWDTARDQRWKEQLTGGVASSLEAHTRYGGGKNGTAYLLSATGRLQETVFPGNSGSATTIAAGRLTHHHPGGQWHLSGTVEAGNTRYRLPPRDLTAFLLLPPNMYDPYDEAGHLRWSEGGYHAGNPMAFVHQPFRAALSEANARLAAGYRPLRGLEIQLRGGAGHLQFSEELLVPVAAQDPALLPRGSSFFGSQRITAWVWEPSADWQLPQGRSHTGTLSAGATFQQALRRKEQVTAQGYLDDALLRIPEQAPQVSAAAAHSLYRYSGLYGRLTLEHHSRYLLQVTLRRDGSSRFAPGRQQALFGAVGAGWLFSRAAAVKKLLPWLAHGKLRVSFGTTGNDRIGEDAFRDAWSPAPYPYGGGSAWKPGRLYNPDYGWEVTRKWEAALEGATGEERAFFTVSLYRHRSGNLIIRYPLAAQTGFTQVLRNFPGVVENRGMEVEVTLRSRKGAPVQGTTTLLLTVPRNRLLSFPGLAATAYYHSYREGRPLNSRIGYRYEGVDPLRGLFRFTDINGDGLLDEGDRVYLGSTDPKWYGSFSGQLQWKGWVFSVLLYGVRQQGLDPVLRAAAAPGDLINMPRLVEDRWRRPGERSRYGRSTQDVRGEAYLAGTARAAGSSAVLTDASFLRLSAVQLSWRWNGRHKGIHKYIGIKEGQWFVSGENLLTLSRYAGDPETQSILTLPPLLTVETGVRLHF